MELLTIFSWAQNSISPDPWQDRLHDKKSRKLANLEAWPSPRPVPEPTEPVRAERSCPGQTPPFAKQELFFPRSVCSVGERSPSGTRPTPALAPALTNRAPREPGSGNGVGLSWPLMKDAKLTAKNNSTNGQFSPLPQLCQHSLTERPPAGDGGEQLRAGRGLGVGARPGCAHREPERALWSLRASMPTQGQGRWQTRAKGPEFHGEKRLRALSRVPGLFSVINRAPASVQALVVSCCNRTRKYTCL